MESTLLPNEQLLKNISFFAKCTPRDLQEMGLALRVSEHRKGETLLFQGMIPNELYVVGSGKVAVYAKKSGESKLLAELESGSCFGEISLLKQCAATATIKVAQDGTEIYTLDHEVILKVLDRNPDVMADIQAKIEERNQGRQAAFAKKEEAAPQPVAATASTTY